MAESTITAGYTSTNLPMECSVPGLAEDIAGPETFFPAHAELDVALLTGCQDRPYAFGLSMALVSKGIRLDVIGSDEVDSPELHTNRNLHFLNLRKRQRRDSSLAKKVWRSLAYYARLIRYAASAKPKMFHILWNNKFETRTTRF
jgi:hypothetical protein